MRQLKLTPLTPEEARQRAEQMEADRRFWAALGTAGLSAEALAHHPRSEEDANWVIGLVQQYQHQGPGHEALLTAAHGAWVRHLNQHADRPEQADRDLTFFVRNAVLQAIQDHADGPQEAAG